MICLRQKNEMTIPFSLSELVAVQKHNELKVLLKLNYTGVQKIIKSAVFVGGQ